MSVKGRNLKLLRKILDSQEKHQGDLQAVKETLEAGADVNAVFPDGQTPLLIALERGDQELVNLLNMAAMRE